jgi:DNA-binding transcriptional LysR family regulator
MTERVWRPDSLPGSRHDTVVSVLPPDWAFRSRLRLRHLQLLVALDDARNLNRAAAALHLTQPAASRLLAELEHIAGAAAFERRARGMEPNALGRILVRHARILVLGFARAAEEMNDLRSGLGGTVAIGAVTGPAVEVVPRALEIARAENPRINVTVEVETTPRLVAELLQGRFDFVLSRLVPDLDPSLIEYVPVDREELALLVRAGHPLTASRRVTMEEITAFPWVLQPPGTLLRHQVDLLFNSLSQPPPRPALNTSSVLLTLAFLLRGDSIGVISAPVASILAGHGQFARLPLPAEAVDLAVEPYGIVRLRDRPLSAQALRMLEIVRSLTG